MIRLEQLSTELVDALRQTSEDRRRQAAIAACHFARTHSNLQHPLVSEMLQRLENREKFSAQQKSEIENLVTQLDEKYFDLYAAADAKREAGQDGNAEQERGTKLFCQARAANSLLCAMEEDSLLASNTAIYEAAAARMTDLELEELFNIILEILSKVVEYGLQ